MLNFQVLTSSDGCSKYVCKYIAKIDEHNCAVVSVNGAYTVVTKATLKLRLQKWVRINKDKK